jgi:uncharacterized protein (DUF58 family)
MDATRAPAPSVELAVELADLLEEVRRIDVLSKRLVTEMMAGGYSSAFRGGGLEFDGVREYVEGDARRLIDWNVTARMGRPFVKTYIDERELTVMFLLDLSASMQGGFSGWSARQAAARICGCLALTAVRNNDKVGLVAFSGGVDKFVKPAKGAGHALRIVRDCLALKGARATGRLETGRQKTGQQETNLVPALEFTAKAVRRHAVVFVVSDFLTDGWQDAITLCGRRHDVVAVRLRTPEMEPPRSGVMRVRDPESHAEHTVDWGNERVRTAYRAAISAEDLRIEDQLRRAQVDRMDVAIPRERDPDAIASPILRFFRMRAQRGAKR